MAWQYLKGASVAIWLEMRCEGRGDNRRCPSNSNDGPMALVGDTLADVQHGYRELREQAGRLRWRQTRKGWFCPVCTDGVKTPLEGRDG